MFLELYLLHTYIYSYDSYFIFVHHQTYSMDFLKGFLKIV